MCKVLLGAVGNLKKNNKKKQRKKEEIAVCMLPGGTSRMESHGSIRPMAGCSTELMWLVPMFRAAPGVTG